MFSFSGFYHGRTSLFTSISPTQLPLNCAQELQRQLNMGNGAVQARGCGPMHVTNLEYLMVTSLLGSQKHKLLVKQYSRIKWPQLCRRLQALTQRAPAPIPGEAEPARGEANVHVDPYASDTLPAPRHHYIDLF